MIHRIIWQAVCLWERLYEYATSRNNWAVENAWFYIFDGNDENDGMMKQKILVNLVDPSFK